MTDHSHPVLSVGEAAKLADVSGKTVARWIDRGDLPGHRGPGLPGRNRPRRVVRSDLESFLRSRGGGGPEALDRSPRSDGEAIDPTGPSVRGRSEPEGASAARPGLLTAADLAGRLGVKTATVLRWGRQGRIPARRLSPKVLRFDLVEVLSALSPADSKGGAA